MKGVWGIIDDIRADSTILIDDRGSQNGVKLLKPAKMKLEWN